MITIGAAVRERPPAPHARQLQGFPARPVSQLMRQARERIMRQVGLFLLASLLLTCAAGPSGPTASRSAAVTNDSGKSARVTLDIFSGRENPSWEFSGERLGALASVLEALPETEPAAFFDGLGYRGFRVVITDEATGKTGGIKAWKGLVLYSAGGVDKVLKDKDRRVERLLLESSGGHLEADIRDAVRLEIEPPRP